MADKNHAAQAKQDRSALGIAGELGLYRFELVLKKHRGDLALKR